jgi:Methyltransferase domain
MEKLTERRLQWCPELGVGYFHVTEAPYDQAYFDRFARQALDPIGQQLMTSRVHFVEQYYRGPLVDVGIGSGAFIDKRNARRPGMTRGFDINPAGIAWLDERDLWADPYAYKQTAVSLWDVLEHIHDFRPLLANVERWVFLALPIFRDCDHVLRSKHYRKDEHFWYFTRRGLLNIMLELGFELIGDSDMETKAGREDIGAFAFKRA